MNSSGIVLNNTNSFDIFKPNLGFDTNIINTNLENVFSNEILTTSFEDIKIYPITNKTQLTEKDLEKKPNSNKRSLEKKHDKKKHKTHKVKKCIYKLLHGKKKHKFHKAKKLIIPILLGLFVLKSLLISLVLKTLIFIASKGLLMGFFSTIMTSVMGFRGVFQHGYGRHHRKRDRDPYDIIRVPTRYGDDLYYEKRYRRKDLVQKPTKGYVKKN